MLFRKTRFERLGEVKKLIFAEHFLFLLPLILDWELENEIADMYETSDQKADEYGISNF